MKKFCLFAILIWILAFPAWVWGETASRGISVVAQNGKEIPLYGKSYALIVGNGNYTQGWDPLPGAVKDAREVAEALKKQGFEVQLETNLNRRQFARVFREFALKKGNEKNCRLLFYYAGHGHTIPMATGEEMGYLVMSDAPMPENDPVGFDEKTIDMQFIVTQAKKIRARHTLFMFDSCFSGTILNLREKVAPKNISDNIKHPVRQFITAGRANEPVPDYSVFKQCFLDLIEGRDKEPIEDGYITGEELGLYLKNKVPTYNSNQHPQFGKIKDPKLDKGDFIFASASTGYYHKPVTPGPVVLPEQDGTSFDDLENAVSQREEAQNKWQEWQNARAMDFEKATRYENKSIATSEEKVKYWERFQSVVSQNNPHSTDDDDMRFHAQSRIIYWVNYKITSGRLIQESDCWKVNSFATSSGLPLKLHFLVEGCKSQGVIPPKLTFMELDPDTEAALGGKANVPYRPESLTSFIRPKPKHRIKNPLKIVFLPLGKPPKNDPELYVDFLSSLGMLDFTAQITAARVPMEYYNPEDHKFHKTKVLYDLLNMKKFAQNMEEYLDAHAILEEMLALLDNRSMDSDSIYSKPIVFALWPGVPIIPTPEITGPSKARASYVMVLNIARKRSSWGRSEGKMESLCEKMKWKFYDVRRGTTDNKTFSNLIKNAYGSRDLRDYLGRQWIITVESKYEGKAASRLFNVSDSKNTVKVSTKIPDSVVQQSIEKERIAHQQIMNNVSKKVSDALTGGKPEDAFEEYKKFVGQKKYSNVNKKTLKKNLQSGLEQSMVRMRKSNKMAEAKKLLALCKEQLPKEKDWLARMKKGNIAADFGKQWNDFNEAVKKKQFTSANNILDAIQKNTAASKQAIIKARTKMDKARLKDNSAWVER